MSCIKTIITNQFLWWQSWGSLNNNIPLFRAKTCKSNYICFQVLSHNEFDGNDNLENCKSNGVFCELVGVCAMLQIMIILKLFDLVR